MRTRRVSTCPLWPTAAAEMSSGLRAGEPPQRPATSTSWSPRLRSPAILGPRGLRTPRPLARDVLSSPAMPDSGRTRFTYILVALVALLVHAPTSARAEDSPGSLAGLGAAVFGLGYVNQFIMSASMEVPKTGFIPVAGFIPMFVKSARTDCSKSPEGYCDVG